MEGKHMWSIEGGHRCVGECGGDESEITVH